MIGADTHLESILGADLGKLIALPDDRAAIELDRRIRAFNRVEELHERSYSERGIVAREFEKRALWRHTDPPFNSFNAWMSSGQIGGRRVNYESKRDIAELEQDVAPSVLAQIPKSSIKTMIQASTAVRRDAAFQQAACTLSPERFVEYVERDFPGQHLERAQAVTFVLPRSAARAVEQVIARAIEHGAANRNEVFQDAMVNFELSRLVDEASK